jgi:sec-independent protein translocase protein TatB
MFDIGIGFSELMLLAVVVIIVVGPEELPSLLRTVGRYVGQVKRVADDFRSQVNEAIKDPMEDIQESIDGVTESLDDDPFGEEDLIDFEEHNQKILDKEENDKEGETATEKALRESGVDGVEPPKEKETATESETATKVDADDDDVVLAKKSGT